MTPVARAGADVGRKSSILGSRICAPSEKLPCSADVDHAASRCGVFLCGAILPTRGGQSR